MKIYYYTKQLVLGTLFFFSALSIQAQQKSFEQLSHDEKRTVFHHWVNSSANITLPAEFEKEILGFYSHEIEGANTFKKYKSYFKPIYNSAISKNDRIHYLSFLLSFISNTEMPVDILLTHKKQLTDSLLKQQ